MTTRRTFLKQSAALGGALTLAPLSLAAGAEPLATKGSQPTERSRPGRASESLNILILGGTGFTGPEQVEYALARGHRVTLILPPC